MTNDYYENGVVLNKNAVKLILHICVLFLSMVPCIMFRNVPEYRIHDAHKLYQYDVIIISRYNTVCSYQYRGRNQYSIFRKTVGFIVYLLLFTVYSNQWVTPIRGRHRTAAFVVLIRNNVWRIKKKTTINWSRMTHTLQLSSVKGIVNVIYYYCKLDQIMRRVCKRKTLCTLT